MYTRWPSSVQKFDQIVFKGAAISSSSMKAIILLVTAFKETGSEVAQSDEMGWEEPS